MLKSTTEFFNTLMEKYLPDAFIFAILLTFIVGGAGIILTPSSPLDMVQFWGGGLDDLFKFAMEMTLILVCGFTLAKTRLMTGLLDRLALLADNSSKAILLATLVSSIACLLNWGFGLVVAGLFAVELGRRVKDINYGLLVAASYSGFLLWHGGFSGSIPLKLTSPSSNTQEIIGKSSIGLNETIFASYNIVFVVLHILALLGLNYFLNRNSESTGPIDLHAGEGQFYQEDAKTPAQKIENSRWLNILVGGMGFIYIGHQLATTQSFNLQTVIMLFLFLGLVLHESPKQYIYYFSNSVRDSSGIILQFPLYAGIMAMMKDSGLANMLSEFFVSISTEKTFLLFTYWSAGIVNFFVPSGGGQWALQAPFILPAAKELGVSLPKASMAIAWGDAWTNMVQPFWAIPLLSVARISLKEMMGYSVIIFITIGALSSAYFLVIA